MSTDRDPHAQQTVLRVGPASTESALTMILVHGRGASAEDILGLAQELHLDDVTFIAPNAGGRTWYPYSFLAPIEQNQPGITSGLNLLARLVSEVEAQGVPADRIGLLGFSQGACLALEFAARNARRYAAIVGFSGGLIGPPGTPRSYSGTLAGTPMFLGCSDVDPHIPLERVRETAQVFRALDARVDERIYRDMGHTVNDDELAAARALLSTGR